VKPLELVRWLVRLVTPAGGIVLDPFAGSGTTAEACILEGFRCVTIEREASYIPLVVQRINRRRDPVAAVLADRRDDEPTLFDLL
jgi:DNA modification methylase